MHPEGPTCSASTPMKPTPLLAGMMGRQGTRGDGGPAGLAQLRMPRGLALDHVNATLGIARHVYIADAGNHAIRFVDLDTGLISTIAGANGQYQFGFRGDNGPATSALLHEPHGLAMDSDAGVLYVADRGNHAIRSIDLDSGTITTVAGVLGAAGDAWDDGLATLALLSLPSGLAWDPASERLFIADTGNNAVRVLDRPTGLISTVALESGELNEPMGMAFDASRGLLYVADHGSHTIKVVELLDAGNGANGTGLANVSVVMGSEGVPGSIGDAGLGEAFGADEARLLHPTDVALHQAAQYLYVVDSATDRVRQLDLRSGQVQHVIGRSGTYGHSNDQLGPYGLALDVLDVHGFVVGWNIEKWAGPTFFHGRRFYFDETSVPGFADGVYTVQQYRGQRLIWYGHVQFYTNTEHAHDQLWDIGPQEVRPDVCPECTSHGYRYPYDEEAAEGQWELGDIVFVVEYHAEESSFKPGAIAKPRQFLYMSEGYSRVVRFADLADPDYVMCTPGWPERPWQNGHTTGDFDHPDHTD